MKCQLSTSNILHLEIPYSPADAIFHFFTEISGREEDESPFLTRHFHHSLGDFPLPQELHSFPLPETLHFSVCSDDEESISYMSFCMLGNMGLTCLSEVSIHVMCSQTLGTFSEHQSGSGTTESKTMSNQWLSGLPTQEMLEVSPVLR